MTDIPTPPDSWTDSPPPEDFGSRTPTPEEERRWERAMAYKREHEKANPGEVIYPAIGSPAFADENWTEDQGEEPSQ